MAGQPIQQSIQFREWIRKALDAGCSSPTQVAQYIHDKKWSPSPTIPTIQKIMREFKYKPFPPVWQKEEL